MLRIRQVFDVNIDIRWRVVYVIGFTAAIANTIGFLSNYLLYGMTLPTVVCALCDIIAILITLFGFSGKNYDFYGKILFFMLLAVEFPFLVVAYGSVMYPYLLMGYTGLMMYADGKWKLPMGICVLLWDVGLIVATNLNPYPLGEPAAAGVLGSAVITYTISALCLGVLIVMWQAVYIEQKDFSDHLNQRLQEISKIDPLTKAYNRRYMMEYLQTCADMQCGYCTVFLDIDDFKKINDNYGHPFGDEVLINLCDIIRANKRDDDILARVGGEEFMVIYVNTERTTVEQHLCAIQEQFADYGLRRKNQRFTVSGGAGHWTHFDETILMRVYRSLDDKLYEAKRNGKNKILWID